MIDDRLDFFDSEIKIMVGMFNIIADNLENWMQNVLIQYS